MKMDMTGLSRNSRYTTETDLRQLLKCLKCQVKSPSTQKQALLTIHSICENEEDNVDLLREMGGVTFVYNLSKSSTVHPDVKETALGTLGALAEANVHCKKDLCRKETFADLADCVRKEDIQLTHKRVAVYLLFVLVTNNMLGVLRLGACTELGQTLAQTTGCLALLLNLFRTTFPQSAVSPSQTANAAQAHQLWKSVSCALCGCINNPQNEDGQRRCVVVFPTVENYLQQTDLPNIEIFQPVCSFIAMAVANNSCVQESFSACGGLDALARALIHVTSAAHSSLQSCQLSAMISKTLSKCISDNCTLASCLARHGVVAQLLFLLESPHLDREDRHYVLHSLGSCAAASEEHQFQLLQCGGLPLIITLLIEDTNEEIKKAAAFILQTLKQSTKCLGDDRPLGRGAENGDSPTPLDDFWNSAEVFGHRIDQFKQNSISTERQSQHSEVSKFNLPLQREVHITAENVGAMMKRRCIKRPVNEGAQTHLKGVCKSTEARLFSPVQSLERGSEPQTENSHFYECPLQGRDHNKLLNSEMVEKVQVKETSVHHNRCTGCVVSFEKVTSWNFASILSSCQHRCDMHMILHEATERYRMNHRKLLLRMGHQDDNVDRRGPDKRLSAAGLQRDSDTLSCVRLVPLRRRATAETSTSHNRAGPSLTPIKRQLLPEDEYAMTDTETRSREKLENQQKSDTGHCYKKRRRKNFTCKEVDYLLTGVKTYGRSWNTILWSYPFQLGRTNVDLGMKYRRLMRWKAQDAGRT